MDKRVKTIADHYGFTSQANIAIEECSELIQAICKLRRGWDDDRYNNVKEEVADVIVICEQLRYILGKDVDCLIDEKLSRQIRRIKKEKANDTDERMCNCYNNGKCWGTKDMEQCKCGGDENKCDYYPTKRRAWSDSRLDRQIEMIADEST